MLPSTDKLNDDSLTDGQKLLVEKVCKKFAECSGSDLGAMTHREDPWKNAYDATNSLAICVQKITKDSLKEYCSVHNLLK